VIKTFQCVNSSWPDICASLFHTKHESGGARRSSFHSLLKPHTLARPCTRAQSWQESWKILIYDTQCRDVISTLFKVADLRKHGVTLHLSLHSERQPVQVSPVRALFRCVTLSFGSSFTPFAGLVSLTYYTRSWSVFYFCTCRTLQLCISLSPPQKMCSALHAIVQRVYTTRCTSTGRPQYRRSSSTHWQQLWQRCGCVCLSMSMSVFESMSVCVCGYSCVCMWVCVCVCTCVYKYVCVCACVWVHACIFVHSCVCVCVCGGGEGV